MISQRFSRRKDTKTFVLSFCFTNSNNSDHYKNLIILGLRHRSSKKKDDVKGLSGQTPYENSVIVWSL